MGNIGTTNFNGAVVQTRYSDVEIKGRRFSKGSGNNTTWKTVWFGTNDSQIINAAATFHANNICLKDDKTISFLQRMAKSIEQDKPVIPREYAELARIAKTREENDLIIPGIIRQEAAKLSAEERKAIWVKLENTVDETTGKMLREALGIETEHSSKKDLGIFSLMRLGQRLLN